MTRFSMDQHEQWRAATTAWAESHPLTEEQIHIGVSLITELYRGHGDAYRPLLDFLEEIGATALREALYERGGQNGRKSRDACHGLLQVLWIYLPNDDDNAHVFVRTIDELRDGRRLDQATQFLAALDALPPLDTIVPIDTEPLERKALAACTRKLFSVLGIRHVRVTIAGGYVFDVRVSLPTWGITPRGITPADMIREILRRAFPGQPASDWHIHPQPFDPMVVEPTSSF
jgi:hypothetical protein